MEFLGKVLNFSRYSEQQMERTKNDLGLSMPVAFLTHCANFYRNHAKRDPYIEELKMLDGFAAATQKSPLSLTPRELYTNDKPVADTYGDMMRKRSVLNPHASTPITAKEAAALADGYLARVGKQLPVMTVTPFMEADPVNTESIFRIRFFEFCKEAPKKDDLFALLLPSAQESDTAFCDLLMNKNFTSRVRSIQKISCGGVLSALLRECDGFRIELSRFFTTDAPTDLSALVNGYHGAYLVRIPREYEKEVFYTAQNAGVLARIFGTAEKGNRMTLQNAQQTLLWLDTAFLRTLAALHAFSAKLRNEKDGRLTPPIRSASVGVTDSLCASEVTCHPQDAFFANAFYTALLAVIHQSLAGCGYAEQKLSVGLGFPAKRNDLYQHDCFSALIGLYRLQAELGLPSSEPLLIYDEKISAPTLSVFSFGTGSPLPNRPQANGSFVYLLTVDEAKDQLPDFDALRGLLDRLCELRKDGNLLSAYTVQGEDSLTALQAFMSGEYLCSVEDRSLKDLPGAPILIFVESSTPLENAHFIGTTFQKDVDSDDFLGQMEKN